MIKFCTVIFTLCVLFQAVNSRPSRTTSGITRDNKVELPGSERINKRSVSAQLEDKPEENESDFAVSESNIVFYPLFASRKRSVERKRLSKRSAVEASPEDNRDEMEVAESGGMVFLPLFRPKSRFGLKQRIRRAIEDESYRSVRSIPQEEDLTSDDSIEDDLEAHENGLVFRPLFRTRQRDTRSVEQDADDVEDLEAHENGLVFRPLFRTRQRDIRSVEKEDVDDVEDLEAHENGLVFRPLFRTRQRDTRSVEKEDIDDVDDLEAHENGLVFRPLFRARQRDTRSVEENVDDVDDLEAHENGLVFRPLFRARQRDARSV